MKKPLLGALAISLALIAGYAYITRPEVYLQSISPDGKWRLSLEKHRVVPYYQGVEVVGILAGPDGSFFKVPIEILDNWDDPEVSYNNVHWTAESVEIFPGRRRFKGAISLKSGVQVERTNSAGQILGGQVSP